MFQGILLVFWNLFSDRFGDSFSSFSTSIATFHLEACGPFRVSVESKRIFQQQKRIIRIMTGSTSRISCRTLFQKLEILTLTSQYILSSMRFLLSNLEIFTFNASVHNINTSCINQQRDSQCTRGVPIIIA